MSLCFTVKLEESIYVEMSGQPVIELKITEKRGRNQYRVLFNAPRECVIYRASATKKNINGAVKMGRFKEIDMAQAKEILPKNKGEDKNE